MGAANPSPDKSAESAKLASNVFAFDQANQILVNTSLGTRVMVLDAEFYQALTRNLTEVFKSGAQVFLYQAGLAYGELMGRRMTESGRLESTTPDVYFKRYSSLAIGKFEFPPLASFVAMAPTGVTIGLRESFFARSLGKTGKAECHIVRGLLEGTAKYILKGDYACSEVKCLSKGDPRCEFFLTPAKTG